MINRGKQFEDVIKKAFLKVENVSIDRLHDQTTGYANSANICDFIVYQEPYEYYFECKSVHGNTLPFHNISDTQLSGMLEKSKIQGVRAGIICWWVDKDVTAFIPIALIDALKELNKKSVSYTYIQDYCNDNHELIVERFKPIIIKGKKKKVFFEYNMESFLDELRLIK